jgi:hypothetical protein
MAAALLTAPAAFAANSQSPVAPTAAKAQSAAHSTAEACGALQRQWDQVAVQHSGDAKFALARELRYEGGRLCSSGKTAAGTAKLEQAIKDIGLKPRA